MHQFANTPREVIDAAIKQRLEEHDMIFRGEIDPQDADGYFDGKKTRRSMQKRRERLARKRSGLQIRLS